MSVGHDLVHTYIILIRIYRLCNIISAKNVRHAERTVRLGEWTFVPRNVSRAYPREKKIKLHRPTTDVRAMLYPAESGADV